MLRLTTDDSFSGSGEKGRGTKAMVSSFLYPTKTFQKIIRKDEE